MAVPEESVMLQDDVTLHADRGVSPVGINARSPRALTPHSSRGSGTEGRADALGRWLASTLDELDYGILLLLDGTDVVHVNHAALVELQTQHPLRLMGTQIRARVPHDEARLQGAILGAASRGLRRLLTLGSDTACATVSVIPLETRESGARVVLLVLGKRNASEALSIQGFANSRGLTPAEARVLQSLCNGVPPVQVAHELGVAISTVRSQLTSIRTKTGAPSLRALVAQVSVLPPMKSVLREGVWKFERSCLIAGGGRPDEPMVRPATNWVSFA